MEAPRKLLLVAASLLGGDEDPKQTILSLLQKLHQLLLQKLHQLLRLFSNAWESLVGAFDRILPPGSRSQTFHLWAHVLLTRVLPVALVVLLLAWCCCCGCGARRMMRAPGRGGARMPRAVFEGNPRGYFRNLRANKPLVY